MATQLTNYQCPACTGPLHFDGASGKLVCDFCGSSYDTAEIEALYAEKDRLIELRDTQREDFSNRRDYERELRTVSANIDIILGKSHEEEQQIEKEQNL